MGIPTTSEGDSSSQEFQDTSTPVSVVMEVKLLYNIGRFIIQILGCKIVIFQYKIAKLVLWYLKDKGSSHKL
jgi:hypothetical protein